MEITDFVKDNKRAVAIFDDFWVPRDTLLQDLATIFSKGKIQISGADLRKLEMTFRSMYLGSHDGDWKLKFTKEVADLLGSLSIDLNLNDVLFKDLILRFDLEFRSERINKLSSTLYEKHDFFLYGREKFASVESLIKSADEPWEHFSPAPSLWLLDIQILNAGTLQMKDGKALEDGIDLATLIRQKDVQRPNGNGRWNPIPIFFLSQYGINQAPSPTGEIRGKILDRAVGPFRYFQHIFNPETPIAEWDATGQSFELLSWFDFANLIVKAAVDDTVAQKPLPEVKLPEK
ncbi:MAG: hypothetical protein WA705_03285 [Candidatus Ozemobacteraceae bacterium]